VVVNEDSVKPNYKVSPGDVIRIELPTLKRPGSAVEGEDIPLDIIYEDAALLIVNKKAGMVVHPGIGNMEGTLVHALVHHLSDKDLPVLEGNLSDRPGLVHRIDKDTSGILVIAKTAVAMTHLAKQFADHSIERSYQAIVWGQPDPETDTINDRIDRHPRNRVIYTTTDEPGEGKKR
jgi:23S rRNA pseudouridine1911/1915/1917 synthase